MRLGLDPDSAAMISYAEVELTVGSNLTCTKASKVNAPVTGSATVITTFPAVGEAASKSPCPAAVPKVLSALPKPVNEALARVAPPARSTKFVPPLDTESTQGTAVSSRCQRCNVKESAV